VSRRPEAAVDLLRPPRDPYVEGMVTGYEKKRRTTIRSCASMASLAGERRPEMVFGKRVAKGEG